MGLVHAEIELINAGDIGVARRGLSKRTEVPGVKVNAFVDSGAYMMIIPEKGRVQL